ncbi:hypothetical protein Bbelb_348840 [Branchiostoma belcheri]|nr:hypothetical protein Bbelb_348840 [Branchiostoma belcheri]
MAVEKTAIDGLQLQSLSAGLAGQRLSWLVQPILALQALPQNRQQYSRVVLFSTGKFSPAMFTPVYNYIKARSPITAHQEESLKSVQTTTKECRQSTLMRGLKFKQLLAFQENNVTPTAGFQKPSSDSGWSISINPITGASTNHHLYCVCLFTVQGKLA